MKSEEFATARLAFSSTLSMRFIDTAKVRQWEKAFSAICPFMPILVDSCRFTN